jgi:DNA-binding transcriptional LysR family regulator
MNIQIRHIRSFIAVAQEKNFARAAKLLNVSQPALSQTIIQIEQTMGLPMFERTTRSVRLTPAGEKVLAKALALKECIDLFHDELRTIQAAFKSELHVGFMIGTAVEFIPAIVREFERVRPEAKLHLKEFDFSDPSAGLRTGEVNCGIIRPPVDVDDIDVVEIAREKCVVCLPTGHRLGRRRTVTLDDILDEPFIAATTLGIWRDYWLANDYRRDRPAKVSFEASTVESELQAVASGKGISITAESTAKYYSRPGVVFKNIVDMKDCVMAVGYRRAQTGLVEDFISVVKRVSSLNMGSSAESAMIRERARR